MVAPTRPEAFVSMSFAKTWAMAAIAAHMGNKPGPPEAILAAGNRAFESITHISFLKTLTESFGAEAKVHNFMFDPASKKNPEADVLRSYGKLHSKDADVRGDLRKLEARRDQETDPRKRAELEKKVASLAAKVAGQAPMTDGKIEARLPLEDYQDAVLAQVGPEFDRGAQVVVGQFNHFVRLQALADDHIVKDDPGAWSRANVQSTWEESRALGLFNKWLVVG